MLMRKKRDNFWNIGLTLRSSEREAVKGLARDEGRSDANMVLKLIREAMAMRTRTQTQGSRHDQG